MALSREQFMELRQKGLSVEQIRRFEGGEAPTPTEPASNLRESRPIRDTFTGLAKSAGQTAMGIGELGRGIQGLISRGTGLDMGGPSLFDKGSSSNLAAQEALKPDSRAEQVTKFVGNAAQYSAPTGAATRLTKGVGLSRMILGRGLIGGTTMAAQEGEFNRDAGIAAGFEAASGPLGIGFNKLAKVASTELPEWLVRPLLKQSKDAKAKGKDITSFLVESGRVGSVDDLISKSQTSIDDISRQVDDLLKQGADDGIQVARRDIAKTVADNLNKGGAAVDETEILEVVERLSPQAKGLLKKEVLTLQEANKLRSSIDRTLGDRGFLRDQLPFNKEVLRSFTNTLREQVKSRGDDTLTPLFDDYAKNIRLRNALIDQASSGVAKNSLGFYDILTGVGAFGATGNPLVGLGAVGGRRAFESGQVKTGLAQMLTNADDVQRALAQYSPQQRAVIMQFLSGLDENTTNQQEPETK